MQKLKVVAPNVITGSTKNQKYNDYSHDDSKEKNAAIINDSIAGIRSAKSINISPVYFIEVSGLSNM